MTSHFRVEPEVFSCFPGMHLVVALVSGLNNTAHPPAVTALWESAWRNVSQHGVDDARKHPYVDAWRRDFAVLGVSMKRFPTSVEAMLRRALKGGDRFSINPLVDFYNALTLKHACPAGAFDLDVVDPPIELRFTRDGDRFTALGSEEEIAIPSGEIAYASRHTVLTRHFMWRQSQAGLVSASTRNAFLVSEIPGVAGLKTANAMRDDMVQGLADHFGCACHIFVLDQTHSLIEY